VVPTRNRPGSLARCLAALERQRCTMEHEIVVVDDGSADARAVAETVAGSPRGRLLRLEGIGPAAARNRGAGSARGALILFTDDDCEPDPDWLVRLTTALLAGADAASGRTVNGRQGDRLAEASQTIANYLMAWSLRTAGPPFAASNNIACTAAALAAVPFDERFPGAGGEDREWCARLAANGLSLVAEPTAIVVHRHKLDLRAFLRQHAAYGRGAFRFRRAGPTTGWSESPGFYAGLLRAGFEQGVEVGALVVLAQVATVAGFLREALAAKG
jgi:glycosyltransferase involved in cell wall biosynthesis